MRERLEAEREEARELLARMRPRLVLRRLGEPVPQEDEDDADAATLRERLEVERREARELLASMRPRRVARRAAPPEPEPLLVAAACLLAGILLARLLDWRAHAHPAL